MSMRRMTGRGRRAQSFVAPVYPSIASFYGAGGIKIHYDAALGVTSAASRVSAWADQTGNGNNVAQGTAGNKPLLIASDTPAGTPCIHLDDTARFMFSTTAPTSQANAVCTLFMVAKITGVPGSRIYMHSNGAANAGLDFKNTGNVHVALPLGATAVTSSTAVDAANYVVICWRLAASGGYGTAVTTKELYINGVLQAAPSGTPNLSQGTSTIAVGAAGTSVTCKYAEIAEAPDVLISAQDCINLSLGLKLKHGIT